MKYLKKLDENTIETALALFLLGISGAAFGSIAHLNYLI